MPVKDHAAYMRNWRARKRESAGADVAATGAPFAFQDVDLAAILAEPPADDPDVVTLPVRLDDGHFTHLAALMRAIEACHGARVKAPAAVRVALEVTHRAIVTD